MKTTRMLAILVLALLVGLPASVANADFTFGEPTNLGPTINSPHLDSSGSFSSDGLEMYFDSNLSGPMKDDIYVSTRATTDDAWGTPVKLGPPVNSSGLEICPIISTDGLSLYFTSLNRAGGYGSLDIWVATRATVSDPWGEPSNLGPTINTSQDDIATSISCDGLVLYFYLKPPPQGPGDIYMSTRPTTNDAWGEPVNLGPIVNSSDADGSPRISANGLLLFFFSNRPGGFGDHDLYMTRRATIDDDWGIPVNLGPTINSSALDAFATILPDGSTLYFASDRPGGVGGWDLWQAPILPIVDFNGDGIVDSADMCIMVDHWGEYYPLCDIGPMPWGDGIVDVQDLIVLAEHLFEDYRLIGHWKLDEGAGAVAVDSSGNGNDGTLEDGPTVVDGQFGQALAFEGSRVAIPASDSLTADLFQGSFALSAWINPKRTGGTWQQVFRSMIAADTSNDTLFINNDGRLSWRGRVGGGWAGGMCETASDVVPADQWTHFAVVGDGTNFRIYVNGALSQESAFQTTDGTNATYYIGGDPTWIDESYTGIIDDVRIYNVALSAEEIEALVQ